MDTGTTRGTGENSVPPAPGCIEQRAVHQGVARDEREGETLGATNNSCSGRPNFLGKMDTNVHRPYVNFTRVTFKALAKPREEEEKPKEM